MLTVKAISPIISGRLFPPIPKTGTGGLSAGNTSKSITPIRICRYPLASSQVRAVTM